jgi:hypothetical protein
LNPGNANLPIGVAQFTNREIGVPGQINNLFNPTYPVFEFVFAPGLLQAAKGSYESLLKGLIGGLGKFCTVFHT